MITFRTSGVVVFAMVVREREGETQGGMKARLELIKTGRP